MNSTLFVNEDDMYMSTTRDIWSCYSMHSHLNTEKLKVNKFIYGMNFNIRERVRILIPQNLHEVE
jgi:hypothetical protein